MNTSVLHESVAYTARLQLPTAADAQQDVPLQCKLCGSRYQQMGNAVCPMVASALGRCLALAAVGEAPESLEQAVVPVPDPDFVQVNHAGMHTNHADVRRLAAFSSVSQQAICADHNSQIHLTGVIPTARSACGVRKLRLHVRFSAVTCGCSTTYPSACRLCNMQSGKELSSMSTEY